MMYDDLLQEWTLQSTDGQPVTLTFNSFDVEAMPLPVTSPLTSYIWSPNYPNDYDSNYQQVREALKYFSLHQQRLQMEGGRRSFCCQQKSR